ncbi:Carboxylic acid transporter [Mucor velutinosus]|uniref:ASTRA-associated protein 1 n=1 Tax=Mucor velutinosus TaxID=708070 RepID=A0AAN7I0M4_9FUNG|nr:Carboxylic acid transporter [Mucor velutinosus]
MKSAPEASPPPTYIFREHKDTVNYVHLFNQDQHLASCDADGWIVIWKMKTRRVILKWKAHKDSCLKVTTMKATATTTTTTATTASEKYTLISQGRDNQIHIWKLHIEDDNQDPSLETSLVYNALGFCKFSLDEQQDESTLLCFPSRDDIAMFDIYDLTYQCYVLQNIGQTDSGTHRLGSCMAVELFRTSDGLFVLAAYESGATALWEIKQSKSTLMWQMKEHQEPVLDLSIDPFRTFVISSSADNQICKYSLATGDVINKITIKKSGAVALRIRPDNKIFALGGYDGRIRLFSVKSMKPLAVLSYHKDTVYSVDFSQKDNWMVCASQDHRISLWSIF